jgi:hypothetical protein
MSLIDVDTNRKLQIMDGQDQDKQSLGTVITVGKIQVSADEVTAR